MRAPYRNGCSNVVRTSMFTLAPPPKKKKISRIPSTATDMLNNYFSQVEMLLTDACKAMALTSVEAVTTHDKITADVRHRVARTQSVSPPFAAYSRPRPIGDASRRTSCVD